MSTSIFDFAWLIPLCPFVVFGIIMLFTPRNRAASEQLALYGIVVTLVLALATFVSAVVMVIEGSPLPVSSPLFTWFSHHGQALTIGIYLDPLSVLMLFSLALICLMVLIYGQDTWLSLRDGHTFAIISLLVAGVFGLLVFDNWLVFFFFWEFIDVSTYLLVVLRPEEKRVPEAGLQTFVIQQVSSLCFLLGLALLYSHTGSLSYSQVLSPQALGALGQGFMGTQFPVAAVVALLFLGGAMGKSAQFPLHVWLPGATRAPAPLSAIIHTAATSAGIFLLLRAAPLFSAASGSLHLGGLDVSIVTLVGTVTAIFAALVSLVQRDVLLAISFSTISQLGYAIAALGLGGRVAGIFHLTTSIFTSALLLLAAGSVARGMAHGGSNDPNDMLNMGGLSGQQPVTFWSFFVGAMACSGLPFITAGFWSKEAILSLAWVSSRPAFWILAAAAGITAFGAVRQLWLIFFGSPRSDISARAPESPTSMITPTALLALMAIGLSVTGIPKELDLFPNLIETFVGPDSAAAEPVIESMPLGIAAVVGGLILGFLFYVWKPLRAGEMDRLETAMRTVWLGWLHDFFQRRAHVDRAYQAIFGRGTQILANALRQIDDLVDDLIDETPWVIAQLSQGSRWLDDRVLDPLAQYVGQASRGLARAVDVFEQTVLIRLPDGIRIGTLALARAAHLLDRRVLSPLVDGMGNAVKMMGLSLRPRTGKLQSYLLLASLTVLMLAAISYLFLHT